MEDCIFCKIAKGDIPCYKVYEDDDFLGFLDIEPRNKGHVLMIPKEHHRWVWDVPEPGKYFEAVSRVANAQRKAFNTDWVVSVIIGEDMPHAHIWLVPRFEGDGHGGSLDFSKIREFSKEEMEEFADQIRKEL